VAEDKDFQARVQKIGGLVQDLETIADPASRAAAKDLVQLLMDLHGAGLERMLEIVFQSGEPGARIIEDLGQDPLVGSLLVLYGIHPDDLHTRVERKLKQIVSKLHKMGAEASLVSVQDGHVRVQATVHGHSCGSTAGNVRTLIEEAIYEAAPDLSSVAVEGLEEPSSSGFVGLEKLMGTAACAQAMHSEGLD
jgi:Fe-S cluster biogenesis protein NfuA